MKVKSVSEIPQRATIRKEFTKCGNPQCKVKHGPYLYAYWKDAGKLKKVYIGSSKDALAQRLKYEQAAIGSQFSPTLIKKYMLIKYHSKVGDPIAQSYVEKIRKGKCKVEWAYRKIQERRLDVMARMQEEGQDPLDDEKFISYLKRV